MMDIKEALLLWFINILIKSLKVVLLIMTLNKMNNQQKNFINLLLIFFKKKKVYSSFKDNFWGTDLADMQLISQFNKGTRFSLCVIDIFSKYVWVVPLKDKKSITIVNAFQKVLNKADCKQNKLWVDKGSEFYNRSMKSWLEKYVIEMH